MDKRIIPFYDILLFAIICGPMIVVSNVLLFVLLFNGTSEWLFENWYIVLIFAICTALPAGGILLFRFCLLKNNGTVYFHYFPFTTSWEKCEKNIDINWNQYTMISEIDEVKVVKLTKEEKETKVFYKHWFNKYLKIRLKDGAFKYVYVGNYSNHQISIIMRYIKK